MAWMGRRQGLLSLYEMLAENILVMPILLSLMIRRAWRAGRIGAGRLGGGEGAEVGVGWRGGGIGHILFIQWSELMACAVELANYYF